jgi:hypothetical protein
MNVRGFIATGSAALLALGSARAHALEKEQFVPANFYWMGPYAAGPAEVPRLRDEVRQRKGHHTAPLSGVVTGRASWISL